MRLPTEDQVVRKLTLAIRWLVIATISITATFVIALGRIFGWWR